MLKYANFEITEARVARRGGGLMKGAHRAVFDYTPQEGFLYVRSRAISSRCNDNYDEFPAEEIRKSWRSFVGKPVFVNHHNSDTSRARGVIIDAALHEDRNPDGSADTWVEVLMEVDAIRFPKLAEGILAGDIERTSMGCDVAYSVCSACGNKARTPMDYCAHIPKQKGLKLHRKNASTGEDETVLIREVCYGLGFFENSLLVEDPADPTAYFLGVDDRGLGGGYTGGLPKESSGNISTASGNIPGGHMTKAAKKAIANTPNFGCDWCGEYVPTKTINGEQVCRDCAPAEGSVEVYSRGDERTDSKKRAINEVKAPAEIDTLRDESCPICGDSDSFDGERCLVCNYIKPPDPFMDPNLEMAQEVDLRQDEFGEDGDDVTIEGEPDDGFTLDPDPDADGATDLSPEDELAVDSVTPDPNSDIPGHPLPGPNQQGRAEPGDEFTTPEGGTVDPLGNEVPERVEVEIDDTTGLPREQPNQQTNPMDRGPGLEKPQDASGEEAQIGPTDEQAPVEQPPASGQLPTDDPSLIDPYSPFTDPAATQQAVAPEVAPAQPDAAPDENPAQPELGEEGEEDEGFSLSDEEPDDEAPMEDTDAPPEPEQAPEDDQVPADDGQDDDEDDDSDPVSDEETPPKGQKDKHKRSNLMRPALRAIAEQQVRLIATEEKVAVIARLAGVEPQMKEIDRRANRRIASIKRRADAENPAQPVEESSTEGPTDSTQETLGDVKRDQPEGGSQPSANDITNPGSTDTTDVSPDATTTVTDPVVAHRRRARRKQGEALVDEPLDLNKEDVTQPVDGTTGKRPLEEVRIETDIETSPSAESETQNNNDAQGIEGPEDSPAEKVSSQRTFASIRLARLRIAAGIAQGDDLMLGDSIARSAMSDHDITAEVKTLEAVASVKPKAVEQPAPRRSGVPSRAASRTVPSLAPTAGFTAPTPPITAGTPSADEFLFD